MLILGIDEATTNTCLYINQVELNNTRNQAPLFCIDSLTRLLFTCQLQIDTGSQSHLVVAVTVVALAVGLMGLLPLFKGGCIICCQIATSLCGTYGLEVDVAGQRTKIVHNTIDSEVITMHLVVIISIASGRILFVQRYLAYTVDGIVGIVHRLGHTVTSSLHHHTTAKYTTEVSTLDGVHDTTSISRYHTVLPPDDRVGLQLTYRSTRKNSSTARSFCHKRTACIIHNRRTIILGEQGYELILWQGSVFLIGGSIPVCTSLLCNTRILHLVVVLLTFWKVQIVIIGQRPGNMIVV